MLALLLAAAAHAETPVVVMHIDPGASVARPPAWNGELTAKLEFPIAFFVFHTAPAMVGLVTGQGSVDDVLEPAPPISPQYTMFVRRGFAAADPVEWGGGIGLRFRPLAGARAIVPPARGLWFDVNGRYGTRGWGVDGALGWDVPLGPVLAIGPSVGAVWEGGEARVVAGVSVSVSFTGERMGAEVTIP